ncbi:MAG: ACT domain-containing protein [Mariprofundaceae bacterium]|nr:ACT domain-containing protein [Mariprofundaceae bacterium]
MSYVLLSVSGHDRPGIVRDVAESMLHLRANIEDSSMTALRGRFAMMLIVRLPEAVSLGALKAALAELEQRTGLTIQSQPLATSEVAVEAQEPDCVITVHGADQVGIVHGVTEVLAEMGVSIVDLSTRSHSSKHGNVYMMALEVVAGEQIADVQARMQEVGADLGVDIDVHAMDEAVL